MLRKSIPWDIYHHYPLFAGFWFFLDTGILEAVARDFFDSEVTLKILNQNIEEERTGKKEHVVFCLHNEERGKDETKTRTPEDSQKDKEVEKAALQKAALS